MTAGLKLWSIFMNRIPEVFLPGQWVNSLLRQPLFLFCFLEGHPLFIVSRVAGATVVLQFMFTNFNWRWSSSVCSLAGVWLWQASSTGPLIRKGLNFSSHLPPSWVSEFMQCTSIIGPVMNYSLSGEFSVHIFCSHEWAWLAHRNRSWTE